MYIGVLNPTSTMEKVIGRHDVCVLISWEVSLNADAFSSGRNCISNSRRTRFDANIEIDNAPFQN